MKKKLIAGFIGSLFVTGLAYAQVSDSEQIQINKGNIEALQKKTEIIIDDKVNEQGVRINSSGSISLESADGSRKVHLDGMQLEVIGQTNDVGARITVGDVTVVLGNDEEYSLVNTSKLATQTSQTVNNLATLPGIISNGFCFDILIPRSFDYLIRPYYPAYTMGCYQIVIGIDNEKWNI